MKEKAIKCIIFGASGEMGKQAIRYMTQRGVEVVAGIGRKSNIGKDLGELADIGTIGVKLEKLEKDGDLDAILDRTKPNIALDCSDDLAVIAPNVRTCIKHGVNVLMLSEIAYFPWVTEAELAKELDALAKQYGVSIMGGGMQDVNCSNIAAVLTGNCQSLKAIAGENWCILDFVGPMEYEKVGLNCSNDEEFYEYHKNDLNPRNPYTFTLFEIADELGLKVTEEINHKVKPIYATDDYVTPNVGTIMKGKVIGCDLCTELKTEEDITVSARFVYSYAQNGATGVNIWRIEGEPSFENVTDDPRPDISTTVNAIHRMPDLINARPGFLTVKDLPKPIFKVRPLPAYLND